MDSINDKIEIIIDIRRQIDKNDVLHSQLVSKTALLDSKEKTILEVREHILDLKQQICFKDEKLKL